MVLTTLPSSADMKVPTPTVTKIHRRRDGVAVSDMARVMIPSLPDGGFRMRLLLINPRAPESFWSFRWAVDEILPRKRAVNPPLGLATLAALTPASWEVEIVDENVEAVPRDPRADIIGICG